ncbi:MAG: acylphosphatase [Spirochaetaceae bacterium]|jgi:acylphosphatase|nr:acylphosphatase [Spirochaetaceae bacterium]
MAGAAAFDATVYGRVQNVGFRYYACAEAKRLGVSGWIRNNPGGDVEIHAEGDGENLKKFASWLNMGPPSGSVHHVDLHWSEPLGTYRGFTVEYC